MQGKRLQVIVPPKTADAIEKLAAAAGVSVSRYVAGLISGHLRRVSTLPPKK